MTYSGNNISNLLDGMVKTKKHLSGLSATWPTMEPGTIRMQNRCIFGCVNPLSFVCVAYGSHKKQRLFPQTALTGWAL
jgi:hypothetical protein